MIAFIDQILIKIETYCLINTSHFNSKQIQYVYFDSMHQFQEAPRDLLNDVTQ